MLNPGGRRGYRHDQDQRVDSSFGNSFRLCRDADLSRNQIGHVSGAGGQMNRPTSRMREPSSWGGLAAMTLGAIPMTPEEFHGPLAIVAIVCGAVGLLMREWPHK